MAVTAGQIETLRAFGLGITGSTDKFVLANQYFGIIQTMFSTQSYTSIYGELLSLSANIDALSKTGSITVHMDTNPSFTEKTKLGGKDPEELALKSKTFFMGYLAENVKGIRNEDLYKSRENALLSSMARSFDQANEDLQNGSFDEIIKSGSSIASTTVTTVAAMTSLTEEQAITTVMELIVAAEKLRNGAVADEGIRRIDQSAIFIDMDTTFFEILLIRYGRKESIINTRDSVFQSGSMVVSNLSNYMVRSNPYINGKTKHDGTADKPVLAIIASKYSGISGMATLCFNVDKVKPSSNDLEYRHEVLYLSDSVKAKKM